MSSGFKLTPMDSLSLLHELIQIAYLTVNILTITIHDYAHLLLDTNQTIMI